MTVDETRIHHYTTDTKEHSMQWIAKCESAPRKATTVGKLISLVSDVVMNDIVFIYYL